MSHGLPDPGSPALLISSGDAAVQRVRRPVARPAPDSAVAVHWPASRSHAPGEGAGRQGMTRSAVALDLKKLNSADPDAAWASDP